VCKTLSSDFRKASEIVPIPSTALKVEGTNVLIRNHFVGINASDINFTNGVYLPGVKPPFDIGFEAGNGDTCLYCIYDEIYLYDKSVGEVIQIGPQVKRLKCGDAVVYSGKA